MKTERIESPYKRFFLISILLWTFICLHHKHSKILSHIKKTMTLIDFESPCSILNFDRNADSEFEHDTDYDWNIFNSEKKDSIDNSNNDSIDSTNIFLDRNYREDKEEKVVNDQKTHEADKKVNLDKFQECFDWEKIIKESPSIQENCLSWSATFDLCKISISTAIKSHSLDLKCFKKETPWRNLKDEKNFSKETICEMESQESKFHYFCKEDLIKIFYDIVLEKNKTLFIKGQNVYVF